MLRVLICASAPRAASLEERVRSEGDAEIVASVDNPIDAVGVFLSTKPTHVVVDGELDGRSGVRMAAGLAGIRVVPTVLVVDSTERDDVRRQVERRGFEHVRVASWVGSEAPSLFVANARATSFHTVSPLLSRTFEAIVLLGSAGTPHMLPTLVPRLRRDGVPLVVGVHHNPRLSSSFAEWVGDLAGVAPEPLRGGPSLPALAVARAAQDVDALQPNLDQVLRHVSERCDELLVIVASGMQFEGLAALQTALDRGATLVALHPERCPQPAMVQCLLDAGLKPSLCTHDEIAQLIRLATWSRAPALARAV